MIHMQVSGGTTLRLISLIKIFLVIAVGLSIASVLGGCSMVKNNQPWKTHDKVLYGTFMVGQAVDTLQTWEILHHDEFWERNPLITDVPSLFIWKAIGSVGVFLASDMLSDKWRTTALVLSNSVVWSFVGNNHSIGVRIHF